MNKILKFQASWCGPCKGLSMALKGVDLGVPVEEIDIDENTDLAVEYGIRSVPTLVFVKHDSAVDRIVGAKPVDFIQRWVDNLNK